MIELTLAEIAAVVGGEVVGDAEVVVCGPVVIDGRSLDEIDPPDRVTVPALMRGYLRLGAQVCGEPAHDPDFGVGDFPALLDKRHADVRYLKRLRSVSQAADPTDSEARA